VGAPLKPRKRASARQPRATFGQNNALWRLWNDPETRPMMLERA
jgi:hypothetical protein